MYVMMVSLKSNGGHIDDDTDQHSDDRPGKGQLPSLRNWSGWGGSIGTSEKPAGFGVIW